MRPFWPFLKIMMYTLHEMYQRLLHPTKSTRLHILRHWYSHKSQFTFYQSYTYHLPVGFLQDGPLKFPVPFLPGLHMLIPVQNSYVWLLPHLYLQYSVQNSRVKSIPAFYIYKPLCIFSTKSYIPHFQYFLINVHLLLGSYPVYSQYLLST